MADPMPGKPLPDDAAEAQRLGRVAVRAADGSSLAPCHPARARALVRRGRAYFVRRNPPVIRFKPSSEKL
jgi:hypothetical protein